MVENSNNFTDNLKQKYTEIYAEIREIIDGTKSVDELKTTGAISPKLRELVALSSAIANPITVFPEAGSPCSKTILFPVSAKRMSCILCMIWRSSAGK